MVIANGNSFTQCTARSMTIIANKLGTDFVPVKPYNTSVVTLGAGQRTDVLVKANGSSTDSFFMRSNISEKCVNATNAMALAVIFYENANSSLTPPDNPTPFDDEKCGNVSICQNDFPQVF